MIHYINDDKGLKADVFIEMANQVWPGSYDPKFMQEAINKAIVTVQYPHSYKQKSM